MKRLKNSKLATKLAFIVSVVLIVIFTCQIVLTALLAKNAITESTVLGLQTQSEVTGLQVQEAFSETEMIATNMQDYLAQTYKSSQAIAESGKDNVFSSAIFHVPLKQVPYQMETFLVGTSRAAVKSSEYMEGLGAMFEPKMFAANIDSYAFNVTKETADSAIEPYGDYSAYSQEDYYKQAVTLKTTTVLPPYNDNGKTIVTISVPIVYQNTVMGVITADIAIDSFNNIKLDTSRYSTMFAVVLDDNFQLIYDSRSTDNIVGKTLSDIAGADNASNISAKAAGGEAFSMTFKNASGKTVTSYFTPITVGGEQWWAATALEAAELNKAVNSITLLLVLMSVAALLILIGIVVVLLRKMLAPIQQVVTAAENISQGHFDIHLEAVSHDEIGLLTQTFDHTAATLRELIQDISRILNGIAAKNLDLDTEAEYVGDLSQIQSSLKNIISNLNHVMNDISESSDQVAQGSDQVSSSAQALSQGATEQASSIQELAATINEISEQVRVNAQNAQDANERTKAVGTEAEESNRRMQDMLHAMEEISNSSSEIGKIIKTIEDIAFQTNILALNAAVEAARAGAAGKGFAVVADEVRSLATKSSEASKDTSVLIENSLQAVNNGTRIADETAQSLSTVVEGVKVVADTIGMISESSENQAQSIAQVTQGIDQISSVVQTNSATAEESAAASEELNGQAQLLSRLVNEFKVKEDHTQAGPAERQEQTTQTHPVYTPAHPSDGPAESPYSSDGKY